MSNPDSNDDEGSNRWTDADGEARAPDRPGADEEPRTDRQDADSEPSAAESTGGDHRMGAENRSAGGDRHGDDHRMGGGSDVNEDDRSAGEHHMGAENPDRSSGNDRVARNAREAGDNRPFEDDRTVGGDREARDGPGSGGDREAGGNRTHVRSQNGSADRAGTGVSDRGATPETDSLDESTQVANAERRRNTAVVSGIVSVIGAWVALSVFVYEVAAASLWNNVLVGVAVFLAAGYNYYRIADDVPLSVGISSLVALLGIWLIVAPPLIGMRAGLFWSTLVSGLLVAGLAGYNAYEARDARKAATEGGAGTR